MLFILGSCLSFITAERKLFNKEDDNGVSVANAKLKDFEEQDDDYIEEYDEDDISCETVIMAEYPDAETETIGDGDLCNDCVVDFDKETNDLVASFQGNKESVVSRNNREDNFFSYIGIGVFVVIVALSVAAYFVFKKVQRSCKPEKYWFVQK